MVHQTTTHPSSQTDRHTSLFMPSSHHHYLHLSKHARAVHNSTYCFWSLYKDCPPKLNIFHMFPSGTYMLCGNICLPRPDPTIKVWANLKKLEFLLRTKGQRLSFPYHISKEKLSRCMVVFCAVYDFDPCFAERAYYYIKTSSPHPQSKCSVPAFWQSESCVLRCVSKVWN